MARVARHADNHRQEAKRVEKSGAGRERILVCVSASPTNVDVIRRAARLSATLNADLIAIAVGVVLLLSGIRLPPMIQNVCGQLGGTIGPVSMIMIGMLLADVKWGELLKDRRNWIVMALKMIITPAIVLLLLRLSGVAALSANGKTIVYISFMAVITPCATTVTQLAQMYRNRPAYASALNAMTTVISIVSMPLMTGLYYLVM